jgi:hypothetical protein
MKKFLVSVASTMIRWYVGTGVFNRISEQVLLLVNEDLTGEEKRQKVLEFVKKESTLVSKKIINLVIEITLVKEYTV